MCYSFDLEAGSTLPLQRPTSAPSAPSSQAGPFPPDPPHLLMISRHSAPSHPRTPSCPSTDTSSCSSTDSETDSSDDSSDGSSAGLPESYHSSSASRPPLLHQMRPLSAPEDVLTSSMTYCVTIAAPESGMSSSSLEDLSSPESDVESDEPSSSNCADGQRDLMLLDESQPLAVGSDGQGKRIKALIEPPASIGPLEELLQLEASEPNTVQPSTPPEQVPAATPALATKESREPQATFPPTEHKGGPDPWPIEDDVTRAFWREKEVTSLADLRAQAHSPLIRYEYVALDCEGKEVLEPDDNNWGATRVGLAYMPSSIPVPIEALEDCGSSSLSSFDWRRLGAVDMDDVVAAYGMQAASINITGRYNFSRREHFRYGKKTRAEIDKLPPYLSQQVEDLTAKGREWQKKHLEYQFCPQKLQTQLPLSSYGWRTPNPLSPGAPAAESAWKPSPYVKRWQQFAYPQVPAVMWYLANRQSQLEMRMVRQLQLQAEFRPQQWAGSHGRRKLRRLRKRLQYPQESSRKRRATSCLSTSSRPASPNRALPDQADLEPLGCQPSPRRHSRFPPQPQPQRQRRRILVTWSSELERRAVAGLFPSLLNQFDGWVDVQKVSNQHLCAAAGRSLPVAGYKIPLSSAMRAVGFAEGYSMQGYSPKKGEVFSHDPGMDAVRTLGMLARVVAYPAGWLSNMETAFRASEVRVAQRRQQTTTGPRTLARQYKCSVRITNSMSGRPLPESLSSAERLAAFLLERGLRQPRVAWIIPRDHKHPLRGMSCARVHYDSFSEMSAAAAQLHGVAIDGTTLHAQIGWWNRQGGQEACQE